MQRQDKSAYIRNDSFENKRRVLCGLKTSRLLTATALEIVHQTIQKCLYTGVRFRPAAFERIHPLEAHLLRI